MCISERDVANGIQEGALWSYDLHMQPSHVTLTAKIRLGQGQVTDSHIEVHVKTGAV